MNELDWKQPALVGGVMAGMLSVIPFVNLANCCFCAWLLVGGAVAAKMLINRAPRPVRSGEGAQVGAVAGLIAAGIYTLISLALAVFHIGQRIQEDLFIRLAEMSNDPNLQERIRKMIEESANQPQAEKLASALIVLVIVSVIYIGFSTLGGLLGVALFEKRRDQPPPPPYPPGYPQNYPPQYPPNYPPQYPPPSGPSGPSGGSGGSGGDQGGWPQG
jgi:hypothetical protein